MSVRKKISLPVNDIRRFLEPGPIVLVSTAHLDKTNIMTMGWHMVMGFSPSLIGCYIWNANHSHRMARESRECVINIPATDITAKVVGIGNTSGKDTDKFVEFGLTADKAAKVKAPLIAECHANFECRLYDDTQIDGYNLFIWEVVQAHVAPTPKYPKTIHYRGDGVFMISGENTARYKRLFKRSML